MKISSITFLLFFASLCCLSQNHTLKGHIVAFKKYPVNKVKITSKKTKASTYTDSLGNFSLVCNKKDQLVIDAGGFHTQYIKIKGEPYLGVNLILILNEEAYKEVIAGNHLDQGTLTYSLENLLEENNNFDQLGTIYEVIQFVKPQAKILDLATEEGTWGADFNNYGATGKQIILNYRGPNTFRGSPFALLVVDGVVTGDISGIAPEQVKTVRVLTGDQAGHWGVQGGNGVVEITTRFK